jgi:uroporphyrinogen decarboxylase
MGSPLRPDIETFLTTLKRGKGRFVPNCELGVHPKIKERFLGKPLHTLMDEIEFSHKAGYDYVKIQPEVDFNPARIDLGNKTTVKDDGSVQIKWANENEGVIRTMAEFEKYVFPRIEEIGYRRLEEVRPLLPEGMGVIGQYGDIFTLTWELMGFQNFSIALFEQPELIDRLNEKLGTLVLSMFEVFAQSDTVDALWFSDDIAYTNSLLVSPAVLDRYFFPWLKKIGDLSKKYQKPLMYHTDGVLWSVLDRIVNCGVDALHPIEPKAMDIAEVKKKYGDKLSLIGHVDVDMICRGSREDIFSKVKENIERAGFNGGYCVGSGNSIPEYVNFDNYVALLEASNKYGVWQ